MTESNGTGGRRSEKSNGPAWPGQTPVGVGVPDPAFSFKKYFYIPIGSRKESLT